MFMFSLFCVCKIYIFIFVKWNIKKRERVKFNKCGKILIEWRLLSAATITKWRYGLQSDWSSANSTHQVFMLLHVYFAAWLRNTRGGPRMKQNK